MSRLLWLPDVLRAAGLVVHEVSGWKTRSAAEDADASSFAPRGVIIHETRGSATSSDSSEIGVLVNGRVDLSGPIAQCYLGRDGDWHVVAAGMCHHVKTGTAGPFAGLGNSRLMGVEPAHSLDEDWAKKPQQYASYVRGVAAIIKHMGWPPPVGHKEHQPGDKSDPEFGMDRFRADVAAAIKGDVPMDLADAKLFVKTLLETEVVNPKNGEKARVDTWLTSAQWNAVGAKLAAQQVKELLTEYATTAGELTPATIARIGDRVEQELAQKDFTDESAISAQVLTGLAPLIVEAVRGALAGVDGADAEAVADAVLLRLRQALGTLNDTPAPA
jgi:hypothetical protein